MDVTIRNDFFWGFDPTKPQGFAELFKDINHELSSVPSPSFPGHG